MKIFALLLLFALSAANAQATRPKGCKQFSFLHAAEDFALADSLGVVFSAETHTGINGIKAFTASAGRVSQVSLRIMGWPAGRELKPNGIDFYSDTSGNFLFVVNLNDQSIERFRASKLENGGIRLTWISAVQAPEITSPNDVRAISPNGIYISNQSSTVTGREGSLVFCNLLGGIGCREMARGIGFANGLASYEKGGVKYLLNSETLDKAIQFYRIRPHGSLVPARRMSLAYGPDNIQFDAHGDLWIAALPSIGSTFFHKIAGASAPSSVSRISFSRNSSHEKSIFYDEGRNTHTRIDASTAAIATNGTLLITSNSDSRSYYCRLSAE